MANYNANKLSASVSFATKSSKTAQKLATTAVRSLTVVRSAEREALALPIGVPSVLLGERNTGTAPVTNKVVAGGFNQGMN